MDKITFDFENETVTVENDAQKMTVADATLRQKKQEILRAACLESTSVKDFQTEILEFIAQQQQLRKKSDETKPERQIALKRVGRDIEFIRVNAKYRQDLKPLVVTESMGVDILENVYMNQNNTLVMIVDEDGISKGYPLNILLETTSMAYPMQEIRGDVVFARIKKLNIFEDNIDYEIEDLLPDDITLIHSVVERGLYLRQVLGK